MASDDTTINVSLLLTRRDQSLLNDRLVRGGYMHIGRWARDPNIGINIEFLVSGDFPGDDKPRPVTFPDPSDVGVDIDGILYANLPNLIELKLPSGMKCGAVERSGGCADSD